MKYKHKDLPIQCQSCANMRCGYIWMEGYGDYSCSCIPVFWKNKEEDCGKYYPATREMSYED